MAYYEPTFKCSSICRAPLFWFTQDISRVPDAGCLIHMIDEIDEKMRPMGQVSITAGFVTLIIWFWQYCLWCTYPDSEGEGKDETEMVANSHRSQE